MMASDFSGYAATYDIVFHKPVHGEQVRFKVQRMAEDTLMDCMAKGARMIGHVKCLVDAQDAGYLICSVTSIGEQARCEDKITSPFMRMQLTMNIMLYGLNEMTIEDTVVKNARTHFHDATRIVVACLGQYNQVPEKVLLSSHQDVNILEGDMRRMMDGSLPQ
jgi:hypothetical protein